MYNTHVIAILNTSRYMYFHTQQPFTHNGLRFNMKNIGLLKLEWNLLFGVLGCTERCPHSRLMDMNTWKIIGVDLNFCLTCYVPRIEFGNGVECIFHRCGSRADSGPPVGSQWTRQWAHSATAVFFLKLFTWNWPFMINYCEVFTACISACLFLYPPNFLRIRKLELQL